MLQKFEHFIIFKLFTPKDFSQHDEMKIELKYFTAYLKANGKPTIDKKLSILNYQNGALEKKKFLELKNF